MTQCTKCKSCQIEEDESGQPALFCTAYGGPVAVVSDELPFGAGGFPYLPVNIYNAMCRQQGFKEVVLQRPNKEIADKLKAALESWIKSEKS